MNFRSGSYSCPKCMTFSPPSGSVGVFKKQTIFIQSPFPSNQKKSIYFPDACEPQPSGCSSTPPEARREQKHWDHSVGERFWKGNLLIEHGLKDLYHRCRGAERGPAGSVQIFFRPWYSYRKWGLWLLGGVGFYETANAWGSWHLSSSSFMCISSQSLVFIKIL